jgi:hypothetical protein
MKSLLFSIDHVYKQDGTLTPLELNTATGTDFPQALINSNNFTSSVDGYYEHEALHNFMSSSNLTKLTTIGPATSVKYFKEFANYYSYEFTNHATLPTDVTVPFVEDADDTLIIRVAYNTYAIVDDLYARDNYEFHNLISSQSFASPVTFATNSFDTLDTFELPQTSSYPNYVVKARYPEYDATDMPRLYTFTDSSSLDTVKSSLQEDEFIQKYEFHTKNGVTDDRVVFLRSLNLAIGDDMSQVLNISNYVKSNTISLTNSRLKYSNWSGSDHKLTQIPASQFYPTFYVRYGFTYHNDQDDYLLDATGSLVDYEDTSIGTELSTITFNGQLSRYMSGSLSDMNDMAISTGSVVAVTTKNEGGIFINATGSLNGSTYSWYDGYSNPYLVYRDGAEVRGGAEVGYITAGEIQVGDKIHLYNRELDATEVVTLTDWNYEYKDKTAGYITMSPTKQFLMQFQPANTNLFLIQHNFCSSQCTEAGIHSGCDGGSTCNDCGKAAKFCTDCGGSSTLTCSGTK